MKLNFEYIGEQLPNLVYKLPQRSTQFSAGYDVYTPQEVFIHPGEQLLVKLNIRWAPYQWIGTQIDWNSTPVFGGFFAKMWEKSGLSLKKRFNTHAGVIDSDYLDEWGLICTNESQHAFHLEAGKAIAQFVLLPFLVADDLITSDTVRSGGYGSTSQ